MSATSSEKDSIIIHERSISQALGEQRADPRVHHSDVDRSVISFAVCLPCNRVGQRRYPSAANIITGRVVRRVAFRLASSHLVSPHLATPRLSHAPRIRASRTLRLKSVQDCH